ncbi:hypothetical protein [Paenibacillus sp. UMB4589-SE434]|uniref:hypothetical protein n=1 Tax=Paenibacillus sp. UMB4589-SE434 TaxID=3046314 RepID=UPI00254C96C5|nr:hypothetical protein [Paenibacillus sp. UMB4589-SE434]MDK8182579.1 hypothetical protein [Paenibacillus sp. UMB4589-SE434]
MLIEFEKQLELGNTSNNIETDSNHFVDLHDGNIVLYNKKIKRVKSNSNKKALL